MNELFLHTRATENPTVFDTFWMTGLNAKGRVRVEVSAMHDPKIAAELAVMQYLLEEKEVCGRDKTGAGLQLTVTFGAIRKLLRADSSKETLAPYAAFLRTRFIGASVQVENRKLGWVDGKCDEQRDDLGVAEPNKPKLEVGGYGQVELTGHAVEQYICRFGFENKPEKAWRALKAAAEKALPVIPVKRSAIHDVKHRRLGMFALNSVEDVLMVITPPDRSGCHPRMVTVYRHSDNPMRQL